MLQKAKYLRSIFLGLLVLTGSGEAANATSLFEALSESYRSNPQILQQRSKYRSTQEQVEQARSDWFPKANLSSNYTKQNTTLDQADNSTIKSSKTPLGYGVSVTQPIFRGFRTVAAVDRTNNNLLAQKSQLLMTQQDVFRQVVSAYMSILRDQTIYEASIQNQERLTKQLDITKARLKAGDVTKTDLAIAEASVAKSAADLSNAKAALEQSKSLFIRTVGFEAKDLSKPELTFQMPKDRDEAVALALENNPDLQQAVYLEKSSRSSIREARGQMLPEVDLTGSYNKTNDDKSFGGSTSYDDTETAVGARLTMPLYQGGKLMSQLRQTKHDANARKEQLADTRRRIKDLAVHSWESWQSAIEQVKAYQKDIESARIAADGIQIEAKAGSRTIIDVLDAQQTLLNAQTSLARAEHDEIVSRFDLLAATGRLTVDQLQISVDAADNNDYPEKTFTPDEGIQNESKDEEPKEE